MSAQILNPNTEYGKKFIMAMQNCDDGETTPTSLHALLFSLSKAFDYVETEVFGTQNNHGKRVALMCMRICHELGYSAEDIQDMASCAVLHDNALAKDAITARNTKTVSVEVYHEHCILGEEMIKSFPFHGNPQNIILHHHENWDGSGFFSVRAEDIAPRANVLRLADELDLYFAKLLDDPQKMQDRFVKHIQRLKGSRFAPIPSEALLDILDMHFLESMRPEYLEDSIKRGTPNIIKPLTLDDLLVVCQLFSAVTDIKSCFTAKHCKGVARIAELVANFLKLKPCHIKKIMMAAHLHDIGKLTIPASILEKPGKLDDEEYGTMKRHCELTANLLDNIMGIEDVAFWASSHHEKLNGKGYPKGLSAEALPFESRLLACADIYQALIEDRPYRAGLTHEESIAILKDMAHKGEIDFSIVSVMELLLKDHKQAL